MVERCFSCRYSWYIGDDSDKPNTGPYCQYILINYKSRGCPADENCDKFEPRKHVPIYVTRDAELMAQYKLKKTDKEIADALGLSKTTVQVWRTMYKHLPPNIINLEDEV